MIQTYHFFGEHSLEFEDSKTVKELIEYVFENLITMNHLEWIMLPYSNVIIPIVIVDGLQQIRKGDVLMKL